MIQTTEALLFQLEQQGYRNPQTKIQRLVREKKLIPVRRGLYETDLHVEPYLLAGVIYGPSYVSFASALSVYGMIPERVYACTSATQHKNRRKEYHTPFGTFLYQDVPASVYPYGVIWKTDGKAYSYQIATPEKALCDMLYIQKPPVYSVKDLKSLLFSDLRIDEEEFSRLNREDLQFLCPKYHKATLTQLSLFLNWEGRRV